jgi:hypothetical protein
MVGLLIDVCLTHHLTDMGMKHIHLTMDMQLFEEGMLEISFKM